MKKYAYIFNAQDPKDPEVMVSGYGKLKLSKLKKLTLESINNFYLLTKKENYQMSSWLTYEGNDYMIIFIRALKDINDELEKLSNLKK